ncbi:YitT family protein [Dorea formicigenerans]|uniref:YitT family protein n=1 Tax=Dorea formicigenerans TaxID=39486 RepID=A0A3E5GPK7_9FIRM|nr:YitT family protein [Dorea formicigenerans]RGO47683.1 YitT family protein [Dorea formicigenerans]
MLDEHMGPIKKYSILTVGAVVLALANYVFKFPNHFSFGGVAGFAVILSGMFGGSASTYTFVINMLLLLIAFPILGKEVAQYVYPIDKPITNQPVLELVFSFMLLAVCSAIFFFMDASSGGTDIIALILKKYTSVSIGMALLLVDFAVVLISFFVYNPTVGLFSFAGFLAKSFFIDSVIESLNLCKYFTIVSDNADTICDYIHKELNHSATIMSAEGSYSHEPKKVIMTVVNRDQALKLRKFVRSVEPHAFMMITNSSEIIGKGFRNTM